MSRRHSRCRRSSMTRRSLETVSSTSKSSLMWSHAPLCTTSSREAAAWTRSRAAAPRYPSLSRGASWLSPTSTTLGLFWTPHPTTMSSRRPAHRPPEAQPATGIAHSMVQQPGVLPR
ncbi:hypothetical protein ZEAMMB73_Zm00001d031126 [Zea mays]|uniref:Uncharacterized protein n=2 Tax=Zea mays TaxID=4577 RepID=A0A1D6KGL7_MAIZE|nr:hypothetical protein ZEAMMB73_Zm00001d031126 [Zea mays]